MRDLQITPSITERELISINKYLSDINKIALLTLEEEVKLAKKIKMGDAEAMNRLVRANLRFVISVAKSYQHRGLTLGDLINEGNIGLIKAVEKFDVTKGFKFITFAVWWIRQTILMALAEQSRVIRLPMNTIHSMTKIHRKAVELEQQLERIPSDEEIAEALNMQAGRIEYIKNHTSSCLSLDRVMNEETGSALIDLVSSQMADPDHALNMVSDVQEVGSLLKLLPAREKRIIQLYFGLSGEQRLPMDDIGRVLNLSTERVRQLKDQSLKKLRTKILRHYEFKLTNRQEFIL